MQPTKLCACGAPCQPRRRECRKCRYVRGKRAKFEADYVPLKTSDFVGAPALGGKDARYAKEKRQEFSVAMGRAAAHLQTDSLDGKDAEFLAALSEQERRYLNRRFARTLSLTVARERLLIAQFVEAARVLKGTAHARGYATRPASGVRKRTVVLGLSDLHFGADINARENPQGYGEIEERRRLAHCVQQWIDYKPEHREQSDGLLIFNGDVIEGLLGHDLVSGAPLTEQKIRLLHAARRVVELGAAAFQKLRIVWQPGNHGRNKLRHPGRALVSKWDSFEWFLGYCLQQMTSNLRNVEFELTRAPISVVNLHGSLLGVTHGDTEIKLGHPDKCADANMAALDRVNAEQLYAPEQINAWFFGHFHTARLHAYRQGGVVYNGALIPASEYARASGYHNVCAQSLWEAVEGFPVGDFRAIYVGKAQDTDAKLDAIIPPVRW